VGLLVLLAACSATPPPASSAGPAPPPAQVSLPRSLADPLCNSGRGALLAAPTSAVASTLVRALSLPDGDVLVGTESVGAPPASGVAKLTIRALTPRCRLDARFGHQGIAVLDLPSTLDHGSSTINGWARDGSGVVLVGATATNGYVMKLTAEGNVDGRFGAHGVATVVSPDPSKFGSELDRVAVAPTGQIIVGADDGGAHCCLTTYVARLDADGRLDRSFGTGGWSQLLATGAIMEAVVVRSDGSVLVELSRIDTGGGTNFVYELDSHGSVVTRFSDNFNRALEALDRADPTLQLTQGGYFDDDMAPLADGGVELVGTGAPDGAGEGQMYLMALRLSADGSLDSSYGTRGVMRIGAVDGGDVAAVDMPDGDTVYLDEPWVAPSYGSDGTLRLTFLTARGTLDTRAVVHGVIDLPAPSLLTGTTPAYSYGQSAAAVSGDYILLAVATAAGIDVVGLRG